MNDTLSASSIRAASGLLVRPSKASDMSAITEIYGHHVLTGLGSFELLAPSQPIPSANRRVVRTGQNKNGCGPG